ncbi:hypothetical protein [Dactylosporangium sp. CA-092794]|uniref:hypothetical protein n=1 Tax=Dactylosporangium sp. CA-092794 TaxID=3239929 RepID=UPI003D90D4C2
MMYQERHYHSAIMRIPASGRFRCMITEAKRRTAYTPHRLHAARPHAAPPARRTTRTSHRPQGPPAPRAAGGAAGVAPLWIDGVEPAHETAVHIAAINEWL